MKRIPSNYTILPPQQNSSRQQPPWQSLGADYRFKTTLYVDADADTQVIGDIYLQGQSRSGASTSRYSETG